MYNFSSRELRSFKRQDVIKAEQSLVCQANIMRHEVYTCTVNRGKEFGKIPA